MPPHMFAKLRHEFSLNIEHTSCSCKILTMLEDIDLCRALQLEYEQCTINMIASSQYLVLSAGMSASVDTCYNGHHEVYKLRSVLIEL